MNVRELVFRGDDKAALYACGICGAVYSPEVYSATDAVRHEVARGQAEACCAPRRCPCGAELENGWTLCVKCRERNVLRRAKVIAAEAYNEPVFSDVEGDWGGGFSSSIEGMMEYCRGYDVPVPAYAHPCTAVHLRIDAEGVLENALGDMHDGAEDQVKDADELIEFINEWNKKQYCVSYFADYSKVIVIDRERFAALIEGEPRAPGDAR